MKKYFFLAVLTLSISANAAINPASYYKDRRIKYVHYDPNNVTTVTTEPGRVTVIEFDPGEKIISNTYGNKSSWAVVRIGNTLQLGPKEYNDKTKKNSGNTNLVVKTDKRIYFLDLIITKHSPTYLVRYIYQSDTRNTKSTNSYSYNAPSVKLPLNYCYYGFGDRELKPLFVYDDGVFTYFKFSNHLPVPTIYSVSEIGSESITASHIKDDGTIVVHELSKRFNIRLGNKVLGIINKGPLRNAYTQFRTTDRSLRNLKKD